MRQDGEFANHWIADEGKVLMKDDVIAKDIWLGINDSIDNWTEGEPPEYTPYEDELSALDEIRQRMAIMEAQSMQQQTSIANIEANATATQNYTAGQLLYIGNVLYKVTANIGKGSEIVTGRNVERTTLSDQINSLEQ